MQGGTTGMGMHGDKDAGKRTQGDKAIQGQGHGTGCGQGCGVGTQCSAGLSWDAYDNPGLNSWFPLRRKEKDPI